MRSRVFAHVLLGVASAACLAGPPAALAADAPPVSAGAPGRGPGLEGAPPPAEIGLPEEPPVGAEDLLEISVFEIPDLTRTVRVSEHGTISLPLLGEFSVGGLTPMELEGALREALSKKYLENPQVSVFVKEHGSKKVSVLGSVGKPGVYEMLGARTLLQILSEAGGLTKEVGADLFVIRAREGGGVDKIPVDVLGLMTGRDPALNLTIQPGDIVSVPIDRPTYVYVDGAVKTPGRLEELASRPITLGQAIAKAGGATERANLKAIQILRKGKDGGQAALSANLNRIRKGKDPDPTLQDGDVVVVPETFF
jgi:polysaccharide export outer membrane protein